MEEMGAGRVRVCFLRGVGVMLHRKSRLKGERLRGGLSLCKTESITRNLAIILSRYGLKEYRCYYRKEELLQTEELPQKGELL